MSMANPAEILALVATGENETVEFKRTVDNPESVAGEIVAFCECEWRCFTTGHFLSATDKSAPRVGAR